MKLRLRARSGPLTADLAWVAHPDVGQVPASQAPERTVDTVCGYCSTGCSLRVHIRDGVGVNITPTPGYPVNTGSACPKGWEALTPMQADDRLRSPMRRFDGHLQPTGWDDTLATFVDKIGATIAEHGPESVAFISTGQIPTEEMALLGALWKFGMGALHGDGNTRQCMATAVVAYKQAFGFDAPPYTYDDFEQSDVIVLWGSNLAVAHPIMWERVAKNRHDPEIIVVDPRFTDTAQRATQHVPLAPKSDLVLAYGIAQQLLAMGAVDHEFVAAHTSGFDEFARHVGDYDYDLDRVAAETGLDPGAITRMCDTIAAGERVSFWWTMGVNQSHEGVRTAQAIIDLALMTGSIGRPGTGANSITGQCNAMGSRLFSNTTGLLGGRDFADADDRQFVADALGIDAGRIPAAPSLAYDQIMERIADGKIKALWVIATNTAHSWIGQDDARDLLDRLDFLCVQDLYPDTETAAFADLLLPAAGWGEKEGTFINSERRIGRCRAVLPPPGDAKTDFEIFHAIAAAWGCEDVLAALATPEHAFQTLTRLTAGQPCDITGIENYDMLDAHGGIQWPYPSPDAHASVNCAGKPRDPGVSRHSSGAAGAKDVEATERRLFADGVFPTPDGRARFIVDESRAPMEQPDAQWPLILLTGRGSSAQWHTQTRTKRSAILESLHPAEPYVELSPADAESVGVASGDDVIVESRRAAVRATALVTSGMAAGQVWMPMHDETTNRLTMPSFDPHSRQPSYKHCAVRLRTPEYWETALG